MYPTTISGIFMLDYHEMSYKLELQYLSFIDACAQTLLPSTESEDYFY